MFKLYKECHSLDGACPILVGIKMKALGYIRISDPHDTSGVSIQRQREQVVAYATIHGLDIEILEDNGISGDKDSRPGFKELIKKIESKEYGHLIIPELSRLTRSLKTLLNFVDTHIKDSELKFVSLKESLDTSTAAGVMIMNILGSLNQWYRDEISQKTKSALAHKKKKGQWIGGMIPYGLKVAKVVKNGHEMSELIVDTEEQAILELIKALHLKGLTHTGICGELGERGIKTKSGERWWNPSTVAGILRRISA